MKLASCLAAASLSLIICASTGYARAQLRASSETDAIQLDVLDCALVSGASVRELVALEVAPRRVLAVGRTAESVTHAVLSCAAGIAHISVDDTRLATPLRLEIALRDLDPPARSRLVALAIAELITTGKLQRSSGSGAAAGGSAVASAAAKGPARATGASDVVRRVTARSSSAAESGSSAGSGLAGAASSGSAVTSAGAKGPVPATGASDVMQRVTASSSGAAESGSSAGSGLAGAVAPAAAASAVGVAPATGGSSAVPRETASSSSAAESRAGSVAPEGALENGAIAAALSDEGPEVYEAASGSGRAEVGAQVWLGVGAARVAEPSMLAPAAAVGVSLYWQALALNADMRFERAQTTRSLAELQLDAGSLALVPAWRIHSRSGNISIGPGVRAGYASLHATSRDAALLGQTLHGFWFGPCAQLALQLRFADRWAVRFGAELAYITRTLRGLDSNGGAVLALRDLALAAQLGISWDAVVAR